MHTLLILAATVLVISAVPAMKWYEVQPAKDSRLEETHVKKHWESFKIQHSKSYSAEEENSRYMKFSKNLATIQEHNAQQEKGVYSYRLGLNQYADLDVFEMRMKLNGFKMPQNYSSTGSTYLDPAQEKDDLPKEMDWRTKGYVTRVKNQGDCGSCWSFSATGSLEGQHFRKTGELVELSEQNLIDCSSNPKYGNEACKGGLMDNAFKYIRDNKGVDTESFYPYHAHLDPCAFNRNYVGATDTGFVNLPQGNEKKLKKAVANVGPISVAVDSSFKSFQFYNSGIYDEPLCSSTSLDHAVLVVGYGKENGIPYWLVKNSWGDSWGEQGYIRMVRNKDNQCGIATMPSYPLV